MKNTESLRKLLHAMSDFKAAYNSLVMEIDCYEQADKTSVNDLPNFTKSYPFDKSFDELSINQWVTDVIEGIRKDSFKVLDHQYMNTGGNCMVSIFTVWLPQENRTVYALTNEEGCTLSVVDYISNELEIDDYDELMIDYVDWGRVTGHEKYFELYRYCLNEYTKRDCKHFGYKVGIPYHLLSDELQQQIDEDYMQWTIAENIDTFDTDGYTITRYYEYDQLREKDSVLQEIKDFHEWFLTTAANEEFYEEYFQLEFIDKSVRLPYNADVWSAIDELLKNTIEEW